MGTVLEDQTPKGQGLGHHSCLHGIPVTWYNAHPASSFISVAGINTQMKRDAEEERVYLAHNLGCSP